MNILFFSCTVHCQGSLLYLVLSVFFDGSFTRCQQTRYNHSNKSGVTQTESEVSRSRFRLERGKKGLDCWIWATLGENQRYAAGAKILRIPHAVVHMFYP